MLDEIINVCSQENNLTNLQIKSFMIAIAGVLKGKGDHKPQIPDVMVDQKFQEQRDKQKQSIRVELQKINKQINHISEQLKKQSETKISMNTLNNFQQKIKKDILMSIAKLQQNFKQEINKVSKLLKQPSLINSPSPKREQKKQYAESKQQNKIKDSAFNLEKWLHISSQNNNIELKDNTITARNNSFAFGTTKLQGKTYFKVRFNKIVNYVGVGINQQNLNTLRNWLTYYSNKVCYDENGYRGLQGNGYREGQVLTIQIDKNQGTMKWIVGSQVRHKIKAKILTDQKVHHVPFIQFVTAGDSVSILD